MTEVKNRKGSLTVSGFDKTMTENKNRKDSLTMTGMDKNRRLSLFRKLMTENLILTDNRNDLGGEQRKNKRKSYGDVSEEAGNIRRNVSEPIINNQISPTSSASKFRKFGTLALYASKTSGALRLTTNDVMDATSALRARRGTVHGNQVSLQGRLLKKRIEMQFLGGKSKGFIQILRDSIHDEKNEKMAFKFRMWAKIVCYFINLEKRTIESNLEDVLYKRQLKDIDRDAEPVDESMYMSKRINVAYFKADRQRRMSLEGRRILTKPTEKRTESEIYYATIALQSVETISELRKDLQKMLATYGYFERFQSKRFIVKQGQRSESFYTIICGKVLIATSSPGDVSAQTVHHLKRGDSFGELGIVNRTPRNGSIITEEYTEVLKLSAEDYIKIYMGGGIFDPEKDPLLRSLSPLKGWPLGVLRENPKSFKCNYIQRNKVMDGNVNWIYIVKSGTLTVLKKLKKVDPDLNPRTGLHYRSAHEDGYIAFLSRNIDYIRYNRFHKNHVPTPVHGLSDSFSDEEFNYSHISGSSSLHSYPLLKRLDMILRPHTALPILTSTGPLTSTDGENKRNSQSAFLTGNRAGFSEKKARPTLKHLKDNRVAGSSVNFHIETPTVLKEGDKENTSENVIQKESLPPQRKVGIRTIFDDMETTDDQEKTLTEADLYPEFVKIQTLEKGDIFGLQFVIFNDEPQPSLLVVSGGAECIMIKRKLFEAHLTEHHRRRLRNDLSPYPTDEVLQEKLFVQSNWEEYKHVTLNNIINEKRTVKPYKFGIKLLSTKH